MVPLPAPEMRTPLVATFLLAPALLVACQFLVGIDTDLPTPPAPPAEAGARDAGARDAEAGAPDPCTSTNVPPPPTSADTETKRDIVFALFNIDFAIDGTFRYGLNLDQRCTCPAADACQRPLGADAACDSPRGVDSALTPLLGTLRAFKVVDQTTLNEGLRTGTSGALVRIEGYNGLADDPRVVVSVYGSTGSEERPTGKPEDRWKVDVASLAGGVPYRPAYRDETAYVSSSRLVATFNFPIDIGGGPSQPPLRADLQAGIIVADIGPGGESLDGVIAGRWATKSILQDIESFPDPLAPARTICGDSGTYDLVKKLVCGAADIPSAPASDGQGRACDALSLHVNFKALRASFGAVERRPDAGGPSCGTGPLPSCF